MSEIKLNDNQEKAFQIIIEHGLDINLCHDSVFIINGWDAMNELVALYNSVPIDYVDDGCVDTDRAAIDKEFFNIDLILKDWEFGDTYSCCDMCGNSVRTAPDSWSWVADYWIKDGTLLCGDCIRNDESLIEDYVDSLINNNGDANTILTETILENLGFQKCICDKDGNECAFENGWHPGQNDDPKKILKKAVEKNKDKEYVFEITNVSQFSVGFTLWSRNIGRSHYGELK